MKKPQLISESLQPTMGTSSQEVTPSLIDLEERHHRRQWLRAALMSPQGMPIPELKLNRPD
ncbi:MAG: hypothetical protein KJ950_16935 [Proteobacteria bacterium]|nr:hypothetical protein [Pseudomonadota bacterium]MBU1688168.1 hypothetical protein [Pseudomonadota bacterium]